MPRLPLLLSFFLGLAACGSGCVSGPSAGPGTGSSPFFVGPPPTTPPRTVASAPAPLPETERPTRVELPLETCGTTAEGFGTWLRSIEYDAERGGISAATLRSSLDGVTYDASVIESDRAQKPFKMTFERFVAKRLTRARVARGRRVLRDHRGLLDRVTARFGVPAEVLVAVWGLETDYGQYMGETPSVQALATLAYDCRRAERFRGELLSALRILDRGDLTADEMRGAWAGELGQTQFLPSSYETFGVDFDGDGRVDMVRSQADALASTASYLQASGWRSGEPFGVGTPNFQALRAWNDSEMYCKAIVLFAARLLPDGVQAGPDARRLSVGNGGALAGSTRP